MAADRDDDEIPDSGAVFTFGKSKFADNVPSKLWIRNDAVNQVACGDEHTALVAESGRLFMFGSNDWGQLGTGSTKPATKPSCVKALKQEKVKLAACGRSHTLVSTESNKLYAFGNNAEGQLGVEDIDRTETPTEINSLSGVEIKQLSAGVDHSAALTADGRLYVWGGGSEGQLGLEDDTELLTPTLMQFDDEITCVSCGYYHTAFVTGKGELYTFGEKDDGKLGLDTDCHQTNEPQKVMAIRERVASVACGGSHSLVLTVSGKVYSFGDGAHGQLGHGTSHLQTSEPRLISQLNDVKVKVTSCGENHSAVVTEKGQLYTCGNGRHGKLGQGDENFSNLFKVTKVPRFSTFVVDKVSCGGCHMVVLAHRKLQNGHVESEEENESDKMDNKLIGGKDEVDLSLSMSARNRRRLKEIPSPNLNRTLPPLTSLAGNKSSLPSLSQTLPAKGKVDQLLDKSKLPNISFSDKKKESKKPDPEDDSDSREESWVESEVSVTPEDSEQESEDDDLSKKRLDAKEKSRQLIDKKSQKVKKVDEDQLSEEDKDEDDEDEVEESEEESVKKSDEKTTEKKGKGFSLFGKRKGSSAESKETEKDKKKSGGVFSKKNQLSEDDNDQQQDTSTKNDKKDGKNKKSGLFGRKQQLSDDEEDEDERQDKIDKKKKKKSSGGLFGKKTPSSLTDEESDTNEKDKKPKSKKQANENDEKDKSGKKETDKRISKQEDGDTEDEQEEDEDESPDEQEGETSKASDKNTNDKGAKEDPPKKSRTCTLL